MWRMRSGAVRSTTRMAMCPSCEPSVADAVGSRRLHGRGGCGRRRGGDVVLDVEEVGIPVGFEVVVVAVAVFVDLVFVGGNQIGVGVQC